MTPATDVLPRLSWIQVNTYCQCPAKWWLSRRFPMEHMPSALKFGQAIHRAVARFYQALPEGCHLDADELLDLYDSAWSEPSEAEVQFGRGEDETSLRAMAGRMLGAFLEAVKPREILGVEKSFAVEINEGVLVSGFVDLIEVKDGKFWIVDNKTSKSDPASAFDGEQLVLYRLGLQELGLIPANADVGVRFDVLRKLQTKGEFVSVEVEASDQDLDQLRAKLHQVARAIENGIVFRSRSWACPSCPWGRKCAETDLASI